MGTFVAAEACTPKFAITPFSTRGVSQLALEDELLGAFVRIVSVPMIAVLLVAMFKVHLPYGFSSIKLLAVTATGAKFGPVGYEVILLYLACLAALVIGGSGPTAIDGLIGKRLDARIRTGRIPTMTVR